MTAKTDFKNFISANWKTTETKINEKKQKSALTAQLGDVLANEELFYLQASHQTMQGGDHYTLKASSEGMQINNEVVIPNGSSSSVRPAFNQIED